MDKVKVTTITSHLGDFGMKRPGDEYETDKLHAAELKRSGLVSFAGEAATKDPHMVGEINTNEKIEKVNLSEKVENPRKKK